MVCLSSWARWTLLVQNPKMFTLTAYCKINSNCPFTFAIFFYFQMEWRQLHTLQLERVNKPSFSLFLVQLSTSSGFIGFETMSISCRGNAQPWKERPRAILGPISIAIILWHVDRSLNRHARSIMQTRHHGDYLSKWLPYRIYCFLRVSALIAGLNIGESIMVPRFGATCPTENSCQKGLKKQTLRECP